MAGEDPAPSGASIHQDNSTDLMNGGPSLHHEHAAPPKGVTWPTSPSLLTELGAEDRDRATASHATHQVPVPGPHEGNVGGPRSRTYASVRSYADEEDRAEGGAFPHISKPVELLRNSYDCIVIGSGYGGGVAASRMARAGQSVCVLERGKEKWPGEYPSGSESALEELHWSGTFQPSSYCDGIAVDGGDPTGMYHLIFGKGQNAFVGNGLGGTSLINANVFLEANHDSLSMQAWPEEIRNNPTCLDSSKKVLDPQQYPADWPKLPKLDLLEKQAEALSMREKFRRVHQTTRFRNGPNSCGVEMLPSALTGQDATGVNDGSKTTTLVTYLADAWNWGAEMFCECEVRYIEKCKDPNRGGYNVYFAWHGRNRGHFKANLHDDLMWVHAKEAVFLGAGAIGTTEILLRSKELGLHMSDQVGLNMSGNGDMLAFGYNTDHTVNSIGRPFPSPYNPVGPCITGIIDNREGHANPLDGYVIEEGTVPKALAPFFQAMLDMMPGSISSEEGITAKAQASLARWGSRILGPYFKDGAIERTQVYLIMSHDSNQAVLSLKDGKPVLEFLGVGRSDHVKELNTVLAKATKAVGGTLVQTPFFALMGEQEVTVHPIGGACMARDGTAATGVVNHVGEVFTNEGGEDVDRAVHEGLIVMDAAVIPAALGANPFATITALAERSVEAYCHKKRLEIKRDENGILDLFGEPQQRRKKRSSTRSTMSSSSDDNKMPSTMTATMAQEMAIERADIDSVNGAAHVISSADAIKASGFGFTEVMSGFIHHDEEGMREDRRSTYELGYRTAKSLCESARFFLSVQAFNVNNIVQNDQHKGMLTGTFVCPTIPGSPFMVQRGQFNLFKLDLKAPGTRNLTYDFDMTGVSGELLHFHGYKVVDSSVALSPFQFWRSTTTLYVTISRKKQTDPIMPIIPGDGVEDDDDATDEAWRRMHVVAKGIMHIQPADFFSEMMTLSPTGSSILQKAMSAASFMTFFTRKSMSLFLAPLTSLQYPSTTYSSYVNNTLPDKSFDIWSIDNVCTKMHMWNATHPPSDGSPIQDLFMIPGASVDHQIFALPTIPYNAVNYFTRAGYRVFVTVHRIGSVMIAENDWTTFDARLDLKACLQTIRKLNLHEHKENTGLSDKELTRSGWQPPKTYCIAHCMGSVAFSCGLLDGTIPSAWIKGISCSQVFMNPIWNTMNLIKATAGPIPLDKLYKMLAGNWFSCSTSRDDSLVQKGLNQLLRFMPDARREICNSASCHRITLTYGRCWNHCNLNEATHRQIDRFFGGVNMRLLHLLMRMGVDGHVMGNGPLFETLTTNKNIERLRGIPFLLFVGADNAVLSPEATERTYEKLCDVFGTRAGGGAAGVFGEGRDDSGIQYRRRVVPGYGHLDCWMGRNAWKDVYPMVREEVDRVCHGDRYHFKEPDDRFKMMVDNGELLY
ncbi:FAD/NAD(P)-binding domain-containing protein [Cryphonectria parasitica EP155]|uniref:FAD/NAD(P)-binding domain-containing protein n=1 Tax=Cryphonectria parasitica (strain ATCC 38755 / EP155) TaxID=660469 RepID=A0A9P4XSU2_CRYP1|nr:FAD/NAD(P)-binding domain-containing protein [Cryphonectria parasitica EP155]KAF3760304.1 FAD/NAD(P)-binding domain-containing protein [Cryphonectria parasitica EP155]